MKKPQENDGVGDISSLFQRHCQTNDLLVYFLKLFYFGAMYPGENDVGVLGTKKAEKYA